MSPSPLAERSGRLGRPRVPWSTSALFCLLVIIGVLTPSRVAAFIHDSLDGNDQGDHRVDLDHLDNTDLSHALSMTDISGNVYYGCLRGYCGMVSGPDQPHKRRLDHFCIQHQCSTEPKKGPTGCFPREPCVAGKCLRYGKAGAVEELDSINGPCKVAADCFDTTFYTGSYGKPPNRFLARSNFDQSVPPVVRQKREEWLADLVKREVVAPPSAASGTS